MGLVALTTFPATAAQACCSDTGRVIVAMPVHQVGRVRTARRVALTTNKRALFAAVEVNAHTVRR